MELSSLLHRPCWCLQSAFSTVLQVIFERCFQIHLPQALLSQWCPSVYTFWSVILPSQGFISSHTFPSYLPLLPSVLAKCLHWLSVPWARACMILLTPFSGLGMSSSPYFFYLLNHAYPSSWPLRLTTNLASTFDSCCFVSLLNVNIFHPQANDKVSLLEASWH